jgi:hypothetical protein
VTLVIFPILMCTVSLTLRGIMDVTVHNQYPDIELVSPVYFCNRGVYNEYPVERTDVGAMMMISFQFGLDKLPGGILMYGVQRKGNIESDHQFSTDATSIEAVEDTSKITRLLVAWKIEHFGEPKVYIVLVEHDKDLEWDEDKLRWLHQKCWHPLNAWINPTRNNWLLDDGAVLETTSKVMNGGHRWDISISEGDNDNVMRPLWIDVER